jgi:hypothetical protein
MSLHDSASIAFQFTQPLIEWYRDCKFWDVAKILLIFFSAITACLAIFDVKSKKVMLGLSIFTGLFGILISIADNSNQNNQSIQARHSQESMLNAEKSAIDSVRKLLILYKNQDSVIRLQFELQQLEKYKFTNIDASYSFKVKLNPFLDSLIRIKLDHVRDSLASRKQPNFTDTSIGLELTRDEDNKSMQYWFSGKTLRKVASISGLSAYVSNELYVHIANQALSKKSISNWIKNPKRRSLLVATLNSDVCDLPNYALFSKDASFNYMQSCSNINPAYKVDELTTIKDLLGKTIVLECEYSFDRDFPNAQLEKLTLMFTKSGARNFGLSLTISKFESVAIDNEKYRFHTISNTDFTEDAQ